MSLTSNFSSKLSAVIAASALLVTGAATATASEQTEVSLSDPTIKSGKEFHLENSEPLDQAPTTSTRSAHGSTGSHGNPGARVTLDVHGKSQNVDSAIVGLYTGFSGNNMCVDQYEITYRDGFNNPGRRVHNQRTCREPLLAMSHKFRVNLLLAPNSKFCGRVKADGQWSPYACVKIIP